MTICIPSKRRLFSLCWLLLLPTIDAVLLTALSSPHRGEDASANLHAYFFTILATLVFWAGAFLLTQQALLKACAAGSDSMRLILRSCIRIFLIGFHLYFLVLWGFMATSGHLLNPESIIFLMDNMTRVPQHLLQTSPLLALAALGLALTAALITEAAIALLSHGPLADRNWRLGFAAICFLVAWHVVTPLGGNLSPIGYVLAGESDQRIDARARAHMVALAPRLPVVVKAAPDRKYPIIVILVESLRYDLLKENPAVIPFLKTLHDKQVGFDLSYATASHSNLTDLAFWYSQYPLRGAGKESYPVDAPWRGTSLFQVFKDSGYATAYISSQNERWGNMGNWLKTSEVDYFFDSENYEGETWENYDDLAGLGGMLKRGLVTAGKIEDSQTLRIARQWIDNQTGNRGFFLGMNLQNTHFSYVLPPGGVQPYQPSDLGFNAVYYRWPQSKKANVRNRYLNAVANVDRMLEQFARYLKLHGIWDECLFVVVGDNGEAFYEHGFGNHSGPMYDEAVRTFSVIKLPKSLQHGPMRVAYPISHIDIAATIPYLAGVGIPQSFQGQPVRAVDQAPRPVYMYSNAIVRQFGIVSWPWKLLITEFPEAQEELYRLDRDPGEFQNLVSDHPLEKKRLSDSLRLWISTQKLYYGSSAYENKLPPQYLSAPYNH